MNLFLKLFLVLLLVLQACLAVADSSSLPQCWIKPSRLEFSLPTRGFVSLDYSAVPCEEGSPKNWIWKPSGAFNLFVHPDGPSGSGRYWNITVGLAKKQQLKPLRGICFTTNTLGWKSLQQYKKLPLPWLEDLDTDGKAELILWESFPLSEEIREGLMAWVYRLNSEGSLSIDWNLSRKMAQEIASSYRLPLHSTTVDLTLLRTKVAQVLEEFANRRCNIPNESLEEALMK